MGITYESACTKSADYVMAENISEGNSNGTKGLIQDYGEATGNNTEWNKQLGNHYWRPNYFGNY